MLEGRRASYKTAMRFLELRQERVVVVVEEDRKQCDKGVR
jgi:exonuclease VII small subunit